ncbi:hypothetical protein RHODO2019_11005 [Rhodococcus antarcticus]|uniref:Excreted virulence factor EspC (Type VII ESX diderm) n=1 Tax=Rhodococcus antarcticus TaxID=2987751 RepID=A0ABY6NWX2_9NOCA|nr:hypothetical protein [Rhodococcus antarcticus]UZJ23734.1 hypothetical protein RHODO2019_11005 [Rhodococcus antarcticus]
MSLAVPGLPSDVEATFNEAQALREYALAQIAASVADLKLAADMVAGLIEPALRCAEALSEFVDIFDAEAAAIHHEAGLAGRLIPYLDN